MSQTVIVVFRVDTTDPTEAERVVEERLDQAHLLRQNDSNDIERGTSDPIATYAVVPSARLLEEAL
jgi:hypothetical protein